jgi:tight adherence protein F
MSAMSFLTKHHSQRGVFAIEFALIGVFFAALLVMTEDVVVKQSIKGKLDRLSYSLANIIRERTQLYAQSTNLELAQANDLLKIAKRSLNETMSSYDDSKLGLKVEQQKFKEDFSPEAVTKFEIGTYGCEPSNSIDTRTDLAPVSLLGRKVTLYQVTLCYRSENLYGNLIGETYELVRSSSITVER